jgi:hypothetical protein
MDTQAKLLEALNKKEQSNSKRKKAQEVRNCKLPSHNSYRLDNDNRLSSSSSGQSFRGLAQFQNRSSRRNKLQGKNVAGQKSHQFNMRHQHHYFDKESDDVISYPKRGGKERNA